MLSSICHSNKHQDDALNLIEKQSVEWWTCHAVKCHCFYDKI